MFFLLINLNSLYEKYLIYSHHIIFTTDIQKALISLDHIPSKSNLFCPIKRSGRLHGNTMNVEIPDIF